MKIKIEKTTVTAKPRQLRGNWTLEHMIVHDLSPNNWQRHLDTLQLSYFGWIKTGKYEDKEQQLTEAMQEFFPGPYRVVEFYNPQKGKFDLKLVFDDPKKEMLWKMKWS